MLLTELLRSLLPSWCPEAIGHIHVGLISAGTLLYSWHVLRPQPAGWTRLLTSAPVVIANVAAPFVYRSCVNGQYCNNSILYIAFLTWWTNSKVLAFCMDRGPLVASTKSLPRFVATMFLPINIREPTKVKVDEENSSSNTIQRSPWARASNKYMQLTGKVIGMSAVAYVTHRFWNDMTPLQWDICLTFIMYLNLCFQLDVFAIIASTFCGVELEPGMNEPYLSSSLAEFWGKRWNLTASTTLRHLVYDPIVENRLIATAAPTARPSSARRAAGLLASFALSGLFHEFIIWFATGGRFMTLEWLAFFLLNGGASCTEVALLRLWRKMGWRPASRWITVPLTLGFLMGSAELLFYPPVIRSGWSTAGVDKLRLQLVWAGIIPNSDAVA